MSLKRKKDIAGEKPPKESTYKFDLEHHTCSDSTLVYPVGAEKDKRLVMLPYPLNALKPYLSQRAVYHHYHDHHMGYYKKVKAFCQAHKEYEQLSLDKLISIKSNNPEIKNGVINATLLRNHNFYWQSMKPGGGIVSEEKSKLTKKVIESFGSVVQFKKKFISKAMKIGIGWIWLFDIGNELKIARTDYITTPPSHYKPLIAIDVWEHAYYVDYGNFRQKYVENYLNHMVNWEFAEANFS